MKTKKVLLSICCITYNQEKFIQDALVSFESQKVNFPIEIIIYDDFSQDSTREKLIQFKKKSKYPVQLILSPENRYSKGDRIFPKTIIEANGKYVALCEGDDYWTDPLKLQKQVDFLESNEGFSGCFHNTQITKHMIGNSILKPWRMYNKNIFNLTDTISTTALFHTSSFVFRRIDLVLPIWFRNVYSGDMAIFALIASKGLLYRIDEFMSVYRKNEAGITNHIKIKNYHRQRIELNSYFKKSFDKSVHHKIDEVIRYHSEELLLLQNRVFKKIYTRLKSFIKK